MQVQLITNVAGSERFFPAQDRAWLLCVNAGSGADGASQARAGDATCLQIVGTTTYTDPDDSVDKSVGYEAIECDTTNAPAHLLLGAWHGTPLVGETGLVQCHGWDHDVLVAVTTAASAPGLPVNAATGEPHVTDESAETPRDDHGYLGTVVELAANMTNSTTGNHAVFWRC